MIPPGLYPAMVTPFDEKGRVDFAGVARLLAGFEAAGCQGAVLAGTNGEGPSLSATEKRDLIAQTQSSSGTMIRILGISTPSLEEARWSCRRAAESGAQAVLLMAPGYFRSAPESGIRDWFLRVLDDSPVGVLVYNFPKMTGFTMSPDFLASLSSHPQFWGAKDSSGESGNLIAYRQAVGPEKSLFVGDETLLMDALEAGWSGSISGACNSVPEWLSQIIREWQEGSPPRRESAETKFALLRPLIVRLRASAQPGTHKAILQRRGWIDSARLRLPLVEPDPSLIDEIVRELGHRLGMRFG